MVSSLSSVLPTSQVFTSGYVNTETILHFFYKITNERGTKTVFTYAHVKWFYGQSERAYHLNYFIMQFSPQLAVMSQSHWPICRCRIQTTLTTVRMNIFVDKSTDRAKPLSICQVAKGKNRVRYYKVKMINKFSHFLNED